MASFLEWVEDRLASDDKEEQWLIILAMHQHLQYVLKEGGRAHNGSIPEKARNIEQNFQAGHE